MMHGREKSDLAIGAAKPANNDGRPSAELVERRAGAEGNAGQDRTRRAQNRASVSKGLDRVRHVLPSYDFRLISSGWLAWATSGSLSRD